MALADGFEGWYRTVEPHLRRALVAAYGPEQGREAAAHAMAWAWEHRERIDGLNNPVAYLFRVGQSRLRHRRVPWVQPQSTWAEPWIEPGLSKAMRALTQHQRVAVVLIHGYGWTLTEVAELLDIRKTTVQNHLDRGLKKLRSSLEVPTDA